MTSETIQAEGGSFVGIEDLDGNAIYLWGDASQPALEERLASTRSTKAEPALTADSTTAEVDFRM
jgi:hypothetical protein